MIPKTKELTYVLRVTFLGEVRTKTRNIIKSVTLLFLFSTNKKTREIHVRSDTFS